MSVNIAFLKGELRGGMRKCWPGGQPAGSKCRYTKKAAKAIGGHCINDVSRLLFKVGKITDVRLIGQHRMALVDWGDGEEPMPVLLSNLEYARHPSESKSKKV